jgi:hypothetical protein
MLERKVMYNDKIFVIRLLDSLHCKAYKPLTLFGSFNIDR